MNGSVYLLVCDGVRPPRSEVIDWLESEERVVDFQATNMTQFYLLVWAGSLADLQAFLVEKVGLEHFLCVATDSYVMRHGFAGRLPKATWDFIQRVGGDVQLQTR